GVDRVVGVETGQVQVAAGDVVPGDGPVLDCLVYLGRGELVSCGRRDPGVEDLMVRPHRDDDHVAAARGRLEHELGEDPVGFANGAAVADPGQVVIAFLGRHCDGA